MCILCAISWEECEDVNEVKKPRKPLMFYYALALLAIVLFNSLVMPLLVNPQVTEVDYSEFMRMTQEKKIDKVMVENNQIIFSDNEGKLYNTGLMDDPQLTQRLYDSGAKFSSQIVKEMSPILSLLISWILPLVLMIGLGQYFSKKLVEKAGGGAGSSAAGAAMQNAQCRMQNGRRRMGG